MEEGADATPGFFRIDIIVAAVLVLVVDVVVVIVGTLNSFLLVRPNLLDESYLVCREYGGKVGAWGPSFW